MITRCENPKSRSYDFYSPLGIAPELRTFEGFYAELGDRPKGLSVERINNAVGYVPGNVKWGTNTEQNRNKRDNRPVAFRGVTLCASEWSEVLGIPYTRIIKRLELGWTPEDALTLGPNARPRQYRKPHHNSKLLAHEGQIKSIAEWSRLKGVEARVVATRLRNGYSISDALNPGKFKTGPKPTNRTNSPQL